MFEIIGQFLKTGQQIYFLKHQTFKLRSISKEEGIITPLP